MHTRSLARECAGHWSRYLTLPVLLLVLHSWGCSPNLTSSALAPVTPAAATAEATAADTSQTTPATTPLAACAEDQQNKLSSLADGETRDQGFTGDLDPQSAEEIPLPGPNDLGTLDSENANTDKIGDVAEVSEPDIHYDFPITLNEQVEFFLDQFQNSQRVTFGRWLRRSGRYISLIQQELSKAGLPQDLCYLPMIESGFRLTAYSKARAVGPWQFMRGTGRRYGLTINNYVDERRDPIKSTRAAIHYLSELHDEFHSWPLAVAAYNAGSGRLNLAIRKTGSTDFWVLAKSRYLKKETKYYVPKLMAAIIIAKNPDAYGFEDVEYEEPLTYETMEVPKWTALQAVALAGDIPMEEVHDLNRYLRLAITPPDSKHCVIRVPVGKKELIKRNLPRVIATVATRYKFHLVRRGDTLSRICKAYKINRKTLLKANDLRRASLRPGERLRIPFRTTAYKLMDKRVATAHLRPADMAAENLILHKVLPGESISELARRYNVPMQMIAAWNGLNNLNQIRAGQTLSLYLQNVPDNNAIAQRSAPAAHLTTAALSHSDSGSAKLDNAPGQNEDDNSHLTYYQVQGGDTLWDIAQKFQTTPAKIRRWNSLDGNIIHPGLRLLLKVAAANIDA